MDHIANYLKRDPIEIRQANLLETGDALLFGAPIFERPNLIPQMIDEMKSASDYEDRKAFIETFNKVCGINRIMHKSMCIDTYVHISTQYLNQNFFIQLRFIPETGKSMEETWYGSDTCKVSN